MAFLLLLVGVWAAGVRPRVLQAPDRKHLSASAFQWFLWMYVLLTSFLYLSMITETIIDIPENLVILLLISSGTWVAGQNLGKKKDGESVQQEPEANASPPAHAQGEPSKEPPARKQDQRPDDAKTVGKAPALNAKNLVKGDLSRAQLLIWNAAVAIAFVGQVYATRQMPELPDSILVLMGISSGTYLTQKQLNPRTDEQQQT